MGNTHHHATPMELPDEEFLRESIEAVSDEILAALQAGDFCLAREASEYLMALKGMLRLHRSDKRSWS